MSEVEIGRIQSKFVQYGFAQNKWKLTWQEVLEDGRLKSREYQTMEVGEEPPRLSYGAEDFLPPGNYFQLKQPVIVTHYLPGRVRGEEVSSPFDYWSKQIYNQYLTTYFEDVLVASITWEWKQNVANPLLIDKTVRVGIGESAGVAVPYEPATLTLSTGTAAGLRFSSGGLLQRVRLGDRELLGASQSGELILLTSDSLTLERKSTLGSITLNLYGSFYQELTQFRSLEGRETLQHPAATPLRERVYPPNLSVPDLFNDASYLEEREGVLYYLEPAAEGQAVQSWAERGGVVGIVGGTAE